MVQRCLFGDSYEILSQMESHSIDLIATDPPYEVSTLNGGGTINTVKKLNTSLQDIKDIKDGYDIRKYGEQFLRILKSPQLYFWCNKKQIPEYFNYYVNEHGCKFDILCWHKDNALPTYSNKYLSDTEYLLYFHKGKGKCFPTSYEDAKTWYIAPINIKDKKLYGHPTVKPLEITKRIIGNTSEVGDIVLDPFMGSGTTGVACKLLDRNFIGIELNEDYFNSAQQRIEQTEKCEE